MSTKKNQRCIAIVGHPCQLSSMKAYQMPIVKADQMKLAWKISDLTSLKPTGPQPTDSTDYTGSLTMLSD